MALAADPAPPPAAKPPADAAKGAADHGCPMMHGQASGGAANDGQRMNCADPMQQGQHGASGHGHSGHRHGHAPSQAQPKQP
jgi:hypothetical protein